VWLFLGDLGDGNLILPDEKIWLGDAAEIIKIYIYD